MRTLTPLARVALDHYLMQRGVPTTPAMWKPSTPLIADLQAGSGQNRITSTRPWNVTKRFFVTTADAIEAESPKTAEKLRRASPHWMRHTHATHALARGAELTTVHDNLRHASVSNVSRSLHTMAQYGLVTLTKHGRTVMPQVTSERVTVDFSWGG